MNNNRWILLPGGLHYLIPVIEEAHKMGLKVATMDYIPENPAHKYADRFFNADVTDYHAMLEIAQSLPATGILAFAVDPAVVTAAKVAEKLNLPTIGPSESIEILQNKACFRNFLKNNGFNTPHWISIADNVAIEDIIMMIDAETGWPAIIKPVDSAGSKGVSIARNSGDIPSAVENARKFSRSANIIIEEFISPLLDPSDSETFILDGKIEFISFSRQLFDSSSPNPFVPAAYEWPSLLTPCQKEDARNELQRLLSLLRLQTGLLNIELRYSSDGRLFLMEVAPRGGGNRLAEMLEHHCGVRLIRAAISAAIGENSCEIRPYLSPLFPPRRVSEMLLFVKNETEWHKPLIPLALQSRLIAEEYWITEGEPVKPFTGANRTLGLIQFFGPLPDLGLSSSWKPKPIGGFIGFDLYYPPILPERHGILMNSGRAALISLLKNIPQCRAVRLPEYYCPGVAHYLRKEGYEIIFYPIDNNLEISNLTSLNSKSEIVILVNYFGVKNDYLHKVAPILSNQTNIIIDNCQAWFAPQIKDISSFYSSAKFFNVPDGGLAVGPIPYDTHHLTAGVSYDKMLPLLMRADIDPESAYDTFRKMRSEAEEAPPMRISRLSESILRSQNFNEISRIRNDNFLTLHRHLSSLNLLTPALDADPIAPLVYPFMIKDGQRLRNHLIENRIYAASYWPGLSFPSAEALSQMIVPLPIDQRYDFSDMNRILDLIANFLTSH